MKTAFVHLRIHSEYSLVDSLVRVEPLIGAVADADMPACAITDQGNVSGLVRFHKAAIDRGVKPIVGADLWIAETLDDREPSRLTLLCQSVAGFKNLSRLLTRSFKEGHAHGRHVALKEWLEPNALEGLIGLSGAQHGEIGHALVTGRDARAREALDYWRTLMPGRFYVELQRLGRAGEADYLERAVELAAAHEIPIVATNDVCFLQRDDFEAHETRVCIAQGTTLGDTSRARHYSEEQHLKSPAQMQTLFADLPEALANTVEIAKRCSFELDLGRVFLPDFPLPENASPRSHLTERAQNGLTQRLRQLGIPETAAEPYRGRLARELEVIVKMGFEGYFLIVADFIAWAKDNAIPVGPGRGSGVGSLVAYALGITNLDPLAHDLLFERFLNPERVSLPDFDVDFCIEGRDRVIDYVSRRYGRDRVSQIVTYGTMAARAVVRDVGRVLGMPYGYVDRIAKLIPFEIGITLDKAIADDDELRAAYESEDEVRVLIDLAKRLEGLARNIGTHAGGVVIAPAPLTEFMPLYSEAEGGMLTQLDKDDLESIGLIKFDFLGLKTLTIIDKAVATINRDRAARGEPAIDMDAIEVDDPKTFELVKQCRTTAVFQLESMGMRDLIKRLQPDRFDDLTAVVALFRPGPMRMAEEFINRKHSQGTVLDYLHPRLEGTLKPTYGVILYQEQVMQIAQVLAGYSLGGADLLRRAMGKKKPEEMAEQRAVFLAGATERGVDAGQANHIFDLMETFAGYGFNKSHAAAYALVAYQTAWLKAHYPEAFMAAVMTADIDNTDRLVVLKDDCTAHGIALDPPDINRSVFAFTVAGKNRISYGLGALKGVGQSVVEAIVAEREANGSFSSLLDLCRRVDLQKLNRRVLEALARSGALDSLGANRATLMKAVPDALQLAERSVHALAAGQGALFGGAEDDDDLEQVLVPVREWTKRERLEAERESLGLYLTGHPFEEFAKHCEKFTNGAIAKVVGGLPSDVDQFRFRKDVVLAGVVMDIRRRGNRVSIVLDDDTERIEVTLFDEVYAGCKHVVAKHAVLIAEGQLRYDDFLNGWRVTARRVRSADEAIEEYARLLTIPWPKEVGGDFVQELKQVLKPFVGGRCDVCVQYRNGGAEAKLTLGEDWTIRLTREVRDKLARMLGDERCEISYAKHIV